VAEVEENDESKLTSMVFSAWKDAGRRLQEPRKLSRCVQRELDQILTGKTAGDWV